MLNPLLAKPMDRQTAERLQAAWIPLLAAGIVSVVVGIIILSVRWTVADLALFVGIFFVVRGLLYAASPSIDGTGRSWTLAVGLLQVLVGIAFLAWPGPSLLTLAIFIGAWVTVSGIFDIAGAISSRGDVTVWWLFLIVGVVEVVLGLALLDRPELTLALAIALVGVWAVVIGALQITAGIEVKHLPDRLAAGPPH